jgi:hypothetical protein
VQCCRDPGCGRFHVGVSSGQVIAPSSFRKYYRDSCRSVDNYFYQLVAGGGLVAYLNRASFAQLAIQGAIAILVSRESKPTPRMLVGLSGVSESGVTFVVGRANFGNSHPVCASSGADGRIGLHTRKGGSDAERIS